MQQRDGQSSSSSASSPKNVVLGYAGNAATDVRNNRRASSLPRRLLWGRLVRGGALVSLAGLAAVGVVQVASWVERSNALPVRTVAVRAAAAADGAAAAELDKERVDEVLAYAGVQPGQPLFAVDVDAVAARVLEHPFVSSATVRRVPPDGIEVVVTPRTPVAALAPSSSSSPSPSPSSAAASSDDARGLYLVDATGAVMKSARAGDGLDLPVVTGIDSAAVANGTARDDVHAAVDVVAAYAQAGSPAGALSEVAYVPGIGFDVVVDDGTRIRIGSKDVAAKVGRLDEVVKRLNAANRRAAFIYLDDERRPERAAVRLRAESESAPRGGKNITKGDERSEKPGKPPRERG